MFAELFVLPGEAREDIETASAQLGDAKGMPSNPRSSRKGNKQFAAHVPVHSPTVPISPRQSCCNFNLHMSLRFVASNQLLYASIHRCGEREKMLHHWSSSLLWLIK